MEPAKDKIVEPTRLGRIYKIVCRVSDDVYIGSTFNTLRNRWQQHVSDYKRYQQGKFSGVSIYPFVNKHGLDNFKILLIKEYLVVDRRHLEGFETLWINKTNCVNQMVPFGIKHVKHLQKQYSSQYNKEYHIKYRERKCEYSKNYNSQNKEAISVRRKEYYNKNKPALFKKAREYYADHRSEILQCKSEYYKKNKERICEYHKQYYKENRDRAAEYNKQYRERSKGEFKCILCPKVLTSTAGIRYHIRTKHPDIPKDIKSIDQHWTKLNQEAQ